MTEVKKTIKERRVEHNIPESCNNFLKAEEVATYLNVSPQTIREWVQKKKIKGKKLGYKTMRINIEDFLDFLDEYLSPHK